MSTITKSRVIRILAAAVVAALCILCMQSLCGCANTSSDEAVVNQAIKYAEARIPLDTPASCVINSTPDAKVEISFSGLKEGRDGAKEITLEPSVVSDTMASWGTDEWAKNRDDLYFVFGAHFTVICKQAHKFGDVPENYAITCPDYMVVYDSQKSKGFIVASTGVYEKTNNPDNPIGEPIVLVSEG